MPAEFEAMRREILKKLKSDNPNLSNEELQSRSYAIATAQWKKTHGGKSPSEKANNLIEYYVPIKQSANENNEFKIRGVAISETTTSNNHKFVAEELRKSAQTLKGVPLLVDHSNTIESIKGKVLNGIFDETNKHITFEAKVMDDKIRQMIEDGRINSVSIGATVENLEELDDGSLVAKGITFKELSLVAVPADSNATFARAMYEMFERKKADEHDAMFDDYGITDEATKQLLEINDQQMKGGSKMAETSDSKDMAEMEAIKQELESTKKALSEYKHKERVELENSYAKFCAEKGIEALDVKAFSDDMIKALMLQISSVKKTEEKLESKDIAPVAQVTESEAEEKESYLVESGNGSLYGGSFTVKMNKY